MPAEPDCRKESSAVLNMLVECVAFAMLPVSLTLQLEQAQQRIWAREYGRDASAARAARDAARDGGDAQLLLRRRSTAAGSASRDGRPQPPSRALPLRDVVATRRRDDHADPLALPPVVTGRCSPHDALRSLQRRLSQACTGLEADSSRRCSSSRRPCSGSVSAPSATEEPCAVSLRSLLQQSRPRGEAETGGPSAWRGGESRNNGRSSSSSSSGGVGVSVPPQSPRAEASGSASSVADQRHVRVKWTSLCTAGAPPFADAGWSFGRVALKRARIVPIAPKTNAAGTGIAKLKKAAALITAAAVETATAETAESAGEAVESSGGGSGDGLSPAKKKKKKKKKTPIELPGEYLSRRFSELSALEVCVCGVETLNTLSYTSLVERTNSLRISVARCLTQITLFHRTTRLCTRACPRRTATFWRSKSETRPPTRGR